MLLACDVLQALTAAAASTQPTGMLGCLHFFWPSGAALKIFESLEMWDQLVVCYRLLDKRQAAQDLVMQMIKVWDY